MTAFQPILTSRFSLFRPSHHPLVAVLTGLKENLDEKARKDKKVASLANVFLLNNFHFIWRSVENSELAPELGQRSAEVYRSWADEQKEAYRARYAPVLPCFIELFTFA
jgi:hypothetical protein